MTSLKSIFIIVFVGLGIGIGLFGFATNMYDNYGINLGGNYTQTQTQLENSFSGIENITFAIQQKVSEPGGVTEESGFVVLTKGALAAIKLPFEIIKFVSVLLVDISATIGLPTWVVSMTMAIIITVILFAIFSAILRKDI